MQVCNQRSLPPTLPLLLLVKYCSIQVERPSSNTSPKSSRAYKRLFPIAERNMEEFTRTIHEKTGLVLSPDEGLKLFVRYHDTESDVVDYEKFFDEIKSRIEHGSEIMMVNATAASDTSAQPSETNVTFDQLAQALYEKLEAKANCAAGTDTLKKYYQLLADNHSPVLTKAQLKKACSSRLALSLRDADVDEIFRRLDQSNVGVINTRLLIAEVLKKRKTHESSIGVGTHEHRAKTPDVRGSEGARISYDNRYLNLQAPNPVECRAYSVSELESFVRDRITERSTLTDNMAKTARKLFTDGGHNGGDPSISFDQVRYTFWKKFRLDVAERDLERFWEKYSKNGSTILMSDLTNGIIRDLGLGTAKPLLEDSSLSAADRAEVALKIHQNNSLESFFTSLRQHINDLINRESRAPHYLLHGTAKMTAEQARAYFKKKLLFDVDAFSADLVTQVLKAYTVNNLVDVKRILTEAMSIKDAPGGAENEVVASSQTLLNGATVTVTKMPRALQQSRMSPEDIESVLRAKCSERMKNDHPHASLYKMFRDNGADTRTISFRGMHKVLNQLDIITDDQDFNRFLAKHDRGDGYIDVHQFLKRLMPPDNVDSDPYVPKDPAVTRTENIVTNALRQVTGHMREVGNLNGVTTSRLDRAFMNEVSGGSSRAETAPPEEHRSVEDLLQYLRHKRIETDAEKTAAVSRPVSPRAAAPPSRSGARPQSAAAGAAVSASSAESPSINNNAALRFDDSMADPVAQSHFPPSALRPGSAPAGRRMTGPQLSKSQPGRRSEDTQPLQEININGSKVERQRSVSPTQRATTLQVGLPDSDYLKGALQSSLRNALRDMTLQEEPSSARASTAEPMDRQVRPVSASATVRPRSSNSTTRSMLDGGFSTATATTLESSAQHRAQQSQLLRESVNAIAEQNPTAPHTVQFAPGTGMIFKAPATTVRVVSASADHNLTPVSTPRAPIEIVSQYSQQVLRPSSASAAKRPSTAPASRVRASPRVVSTQAVPTQSSADPNDDHSGCEQGNNGMPTSGPESNEAAGEPKLRPAKEHKKVVVPSLAGIGDAVFSLNGGPPVPQAPEPPTLQRTSKQQEAHCLYVLDPHYADTHALTYQSHTSRSSQPSAQTQIGRTTFATVVSGSRSPVARPDAISARFVYTGQRRTPRTDPMNPLLACQYKISKNHMTTTNREYGAFANNYAKFMRRDHKLHQKQLALGAGGQAGGNTY